MSPILSIISSHLLTLIEAELLKATPELVAIIEKEIALIITKLETFLENKSKAASGIASPVLNVVEHVANNALDAAATAAVNTINESKGA